MTEIKLIEFDEKCKDCDGTGVHNGRFEGEGAGVVCHICKGTGCHHFRHEYEEFSGRIHNDNIKRVYQKNPGIGIGETDELSLEDFGGMNYDDWLMGKPFKVGMEMRNFVCPACWYSSVDYDKKPRWKECVGAGCFFSGCQNFKDKDKCWERWDKEHAKDQDPK